MRVLIIIALLVSACGTKKHKPCPAYGQTNAEVAPKDLALLNK